MLPPRISVVIPNFNYGDMIEDALTSVLDQNYPNLDLRVLDGGSTDGSMGVIRRYESRLSAWRSRADDGQYAAINEGFGDADGEIFCWLNSDDRQFPWTLEVVSRVFQRFPEVEWITGIPGRSFRGVLLQQFDVQKVYPREFICAGLFNQEPFSWIQQESCFWRRSLWEKVRGLDTGYKLAADFDLWRRFAEHASLYKVAVPLGSFNEWGGNRSALGRDAYMREVDAIVSHLSPEIAFERGQILKGVERLPLARTFLRRWATRFLGLHRYHGSRIDWDGAAQDFRITHQSFF